MTKNYCDRCGKECTSQTIWLGPHFYEPNIRVVPDLSYDLCPTCYHALLEWMKKGDE